MKPILCLDFDGVMHSYTSGWQGADVVSDPPVEGLFEFLASAMEHFKVVVYSSRSKQSGGVEAMSSWLASHYTRFMSEVHDSGVVDPEAFEIDLSEIEFAHEKPPAFLTIDDRAICFDGTWPHVEYLRNFKPWNKR